MKNIKDKEINIDSEPMVTIFKKIAQSSGYNFDFTSEIGTELDINIKSDEPKTIYITSLLPSKSFSLEGRKYKDGKIKK